MYYEEKQTAGIVGHCLILALKRHNQEDHKSRVSLGDILKCIYLSQPPEKKKPKRNNKKIYKCN